MCSCHSYNGWPKNQENLDRPEVILPKPSWSSREQGICVDACIADAILMLWENGIVTRGCCCGHNESDPSVVLEHSSDAQRALNLLTTFDDRHWEVWAWKAMKITKSDKSWQET